jgi:hypothetical protein
VSPWSLIEVTNFSEEHTASIFRVEKASIQTERIKQQAELGCVTMESGRNLPTFRRNILPPSSGSKIKPRSKLYIMKASSWPLPGETE